MEIHKKNLESWKIISDFKKQLSQYERSILLKDEYSTDKMFLYEINASNGISYGVGIITYSNIQPQIYSSKEYILIGFNNEVRLFNNNFLQSNRIDSLSAFYDFVPCIECDIIIALFEIDVVGISLKSGKELWRVAMNDIITEYNKFDLTLNVKTFEKEEIKICIVNGNILPKHK